MPKSNPGKWAVSLILATPIIVLLGGVLADNIYPDSATGDTILQDLSSRPLLTVSMLIAMTTGISAFIVGLQAIFKNKDQTIMVILATVTGGLFAAFLIADLLFPN